MSDDKPQELPPLAKAILASAGEKIARGIRQMAEAMAGGVAEIVEGADKGIDSFLP
jgi:hypothetical protein